MELTTGQIRKLRFVSALERLYTEHNGNQSFSNMVLEQIDVLKFSRKNGAIVWRTLQNKKPNLILQDLETLQLNAASLGTIYDSGCIIQNVFALFGCLFSVGAYIVIKILLYNAYY